MPSFRRWWLLVLPVLAAACQLVDPASDLRELDLADASGATDASPVDAADSGDAGDATVLDSAPSSDAAFARDVAFCQTQDAVLCDDFDRPNGDFLVVGGVWQGPYSSGPDNPHAELYNDAFHTVWPNASRAPDSVYLRSFRQDTTAAKWYLDFDLTGTAVTTSTLDPVYVVIAAMEFDYDGGVNGLLSDTYQLLLGTDNSAKIVLQQTTDAGPLPPLPVAQSAQGDQFLLEAAQPVTCRIEMIVYTRGPQTSNATAICPGRVAVGDTQVDAGNPLIGTDGGQPILFLGYQIDGGSVPTVGGLVYDNVTLGLTSVP